MASALLAFAIILSVTSAEANETRKRLLGRKVENIVLSNAMTGNVWNLNDQAKQAEVIVLYFNSTECPVTNRYLPALNRLQESLAERKVAIVTVNSNQHDTAEDIKKHAREFGLKVPALHDPKGQVARSLAATRTAEAIVLDRQLKVRFRGVIDDRFERGITRARAQNHYLADAIESVLKGRAVKTPMTDVQACPLNLAPAEIVNASRSQITYSEHVASILQRRCQSCHRPDGIGPFKLMTFKDAKAWATSIREVITQDLMPPWHADAPHGHFSNDRSLTAKEYATLLDWIDDGALEGDKSKLPKPRSFSNAWSIGAPNIVIEMEKAVKIPAETPELGVPYKYIWGGKPFEREAWVQAAEVHPGATDVVHHASVYIVPKGVKIKLVNDERPGGAFDDWSSPLDNLPHLVSFVPGDNAFVRRQGLAMRIPQGARLLFEMHYTPTGKATTDRTKVGLKFTERPPKHEVFSSATINWWFSIPPGVDNHRVKARTSKFQEDAVLLTMNPHMHYRGKSFKYELVKPSGERSLLLNVPNYNFEWQSTYVLSKPVEIPKGSRIECVATFDNSKENPFNPDPKVRVTWGEQTWQEMMLGGYEFYVK